MYTYYTYKSRYAYDSKRFFLRFCLFASLLIILLSNYDTFVSINHNFTENEQLVNGILYYLRVMHDISDMVND